MVSVFIRLVVFSPSILIETARSISLAWIRSQFIGKLLPVVRFNVRRQYDCLKASDDGFFSKNFCEKSELHCRFRLKNKQKNQIVESFFYLYSPILLDFEAESAVKFTFLSKVFGKKYIITSFQAVVLPSHVESNNRKKFPNKLRPYPS